MTAKHPATVTLKHPETVTAKHPATVAAQHPATVTAQHLFDRFVDALVERAPGHRLHLVAILARVRGRDVRVERLLVAPRFDDGEMVRAHRVLQDVEPEIACLLAARLRQSSEHHRYLRVLIDVNV